MQPGLAMWNESQFHERNKENSLECWASIPVPDLTAG